MTPYPPENPKIPSRDYGLDSIKAISVLFVLLSHLVPLQVMTSEPSVNPVLKLPSFLIENFDSQVLRTAVPAFFIVSLYLFFKKATHQFSYLKHRIIQLAKIYAFWTFVQCLVYCLLWICATVGKLNWEFPPTSVFEVIFLGGPPLPFMLSSVFYFLFDLILLTILAFLLLRISPKWRNLTCFAVIIASLVYFAVLEISNHPLIFWRLDSFIVYVSIAYFVHKYQEKFLGYRYFYLGAFIALSAIDDYLVKVGIYIGTYGRASVFFGSLTLFSFIYFWSLKNQKGQNIFQEGKLADFIQFVSKNALGIFALQRYWQLLYLLLFQRLFTAFGIPEVVTVSALQISLLNPIVGIAVVISCIGSVHVLRSTLLKGFM